MATQQITIDDMDGSVDATPFHFEVEGMAYTMDLGIRSREKFAKALTPFVEKATPVRPQRPPRATAVDRGFNIDKLRRWADENSIALPSRGRIPRVVVEEYKRSGGK